MKTLTAPFPWFGGKSRVAHLVWDRFGNCQNYVEPFAGSLAVLLARPHAPQTETVNDLDCLVANFWRSMQHDPDQLVFWADYPVNEADLHARHLWLVKQDAFRERITTEPEFYDVKIAGWWVWGISQWIGSGWCFKPEWEGRTNAGAVTRGIHRKSIHKRKIPHLGDAGNGVHSGERYEALYGYFQTLAERLRRVRVCCGDWTRVMGPSVTIKHGGVCGILLDPPYDLRAVSNLESGRDGAAPSDVLYAHHSNDVSAEVRKWAIENGDNPLLRIALCGYDGEHEMPSSWECVAWKNQGGYGSQGNAKGRENAARERIWFSPHCLRVTLQFPEHDQKDQAGNQALSSATG